jgi:hypothetical protein
VTGSTLDRQVVPALEATMAYDEDIRPADVLLVNVTRYKEVSYWAREFKCTPDQLRDAVKAAGTSAAAVKAYLDKR